MGNLGRRGFLATAVAALAAPALVRAAPARLELSGPPAGPSITLAHAVAAGAFAALAPEVTFRPWRSPDEMRAGLTSGTMQVTILPVQVAANLHNRGLGLGLVNVMTDGLTGMLSGDASITDVAALRGRRVVVPFRNDMPDILLRRLLAERGLSEADLTLVGAGTPFEAVQLLLTGRAEVALLPEPAASLAEMKAEQSGRALHRVLDLTGEWGRITGLGASLPQAGLGMTEAFRAENPEAPALLQEALARVLPAVLADPAAAAASAAPHLGMPAPVLARSIPRSALVARPAREARPQIEAMLSALADADPKLIGGRLPGHGFYLV
ncbi:ABC transporter substrate-binding protein (plasmid) [Cereibacter azotoformans]|uniref:ABC transporter substrate-binding protein n=1 Tax=Cereibacter azotoformans TaxID=43057 RepID=UPI001EEB6038|nr:ABC transporter substrate-binding protein [Cereibacter azotoformans]ULB12422.1 ABC transporter substrate-binding protein [Cereibacter azotoformans]